MRVVYILLVLVIPIGELHKLFANIHIEMDVFAFIDYKCDLEWIVKDACEQLQMVFMAYIAYRVSSYVHGIRPIRDILFSIYVFTWIDLLFYFLTFKSGYYSIAYYLVAFIVLWRKWAKKRPIHSGMKLAP